MPAIDIDLSPSPWVERHAHLVATGARLLDVAAGRGRHSRLFASRSAQVVAVDRDAAALAALEGVAGVRTLVADLETGPWPFAGRSFDAIVVTNYLHRPLIGTLLAALTPDGTLIYDVLDTGQQALPGSGVRPDKTNTEIRFHNDNAYNDTPPDYVGLLCLRRAMSGGHSRVISFHAAYNELLARRPERLARLYQPFWFDRQREFHPGESAIFAAPVFDRGAELKARFSVHQINSGYVLKGEPADEEGEAALAAMLDIFEDDALSVDFDLEPGQMQFVDNRALGHSRTAFVDYPEPAAKRHLVRLWLRDRGRRAYPG